jgi:hypothetical protein
MSDSEMWCWYSSFHIDGVWSYDKELKTITLTAIKSSQAFPNQVVTTSNFDKSSKEIKAFVIYWNYRDFKGVGQGILKRISKKR